MAFGLIAAVCYGVGGFMIGRYTLRLGWLVPVVVARGGAMVILLGLLATPLAIKITTVKEEAEECGCSIETVRRALLSGSLNGWQASGKGSQRFIIKSAEKDAESPEEVVV